MHYTGVPGTPGVVVLGWYTGVPSAPAFGVLGWLRGETQLHTP